MLILLAPEFIKKMGNVDSYLYLSNAWTYMLVFSQGISIFMDQYELGLGYRHVSRANIVEYQAIGLSVSMLQLTFVKPCWEATPPLINIINPLAMDANTQYYPKVNSMVAS